VGTITISSPPNARIGASGLRTYTWQGRELPSVTSVQKMAGLPHGLHQWAVSQVVDRAVTEIDKLTEMLNRERKPREKVLESNRIAEASRWLRSAGTEGRDMAAAVGSAVHDAAATGITPDTIPDVLDTLKDGKPVTVDGASVRKRLEQFHDWLRVSGAEVLAQEFQVFNLTVGYGGQADLLVRFPSGRIALVDLKTGKSVYADHVVQLRAYREAEFVGLNDEVDEDLTVLLMVSTDLGILHLAEDHWEYIALRDDEVAGEAFRGLHAFATWMAAHQNVETSVSGRRTNRVCPVCQDTLLAPDAKERRMVSGVIHTHLKCIPGEEAAA
jgi:RecB family exonuclease